LFPEILDEHRAEPTRTLQQTAHRNELPLLEAACDNDSVVPDTVQVFVINTDRDSERLQSFTETMSGHAVPFQRWVATRGTDLDARKFGREPIAAGVFIADFKEWSLNEAACGVSHIRLWQHIVGQRIPWTIVMEDDAILTRSLPLEIARWCLPADAELILLSDRALLGEVTKIGEPFSYGNVAGGAGTEGYLVSLAGARKLLSVLHPFRDPLDFQMYSHFRSIQELDEPPYHWRLPQNPSARTTLLVAYRIVPSVVRHDGVSSSIGNQRHPRARLYCRLLLGLEFEPSREPYAQPSALLDRRHPRRVQRRLEMSSARTSFMRGVDISHFDERTIFRDLDRRPRDLMSILKRHGVNAIRLSVWVNHASAFNLERARRLATRARAHGFEICLVLHYSDTWADPGNQSKPRAWAGLSREQLREQVYRYTREVLTALCRQGTTPSLVQTGNEITNGLLWAGESEPPESGGRLHQSGRFIDRVGHERQWLAFAELLTDATRGVRDGTAAVNCRTDVMLHVHRGSDPSSVLSWLECADAAGIDFDAVGLSFNPQWHPEAVTSRLPALRQLSDRFPTKKLVVAETAYPYRSYDYEGCTFQQGELPYSPAGQQTYLREILAAVARLPTGAGVFWWGACFTNSLFGRCNDSFAARALFDAENHALPALAAFGTA
jgi:arabinogalactan endo-1,4-beta-galactosidase